MPGRLRSHVHVRDERNVAHVFGPDDEIPDWAAARITNPNAWAEPPGDGPGASQQPAVGHDRPPKVGAGSSREDWAAYATANSIEFPAEANKADIIAAVEAAEQQ